MSAIRDRIESTPEARNLVGRLWSGSTLEAEELYSVDAELPQPAMDSIDANETSMRSLTRQTDGQTSRHKPVVRTHSPVLKPARELEVLEDWEGVVAEVREHDFVATLTSSRDTTQIRPHYAHFDKADLDPSDLDLLVEGAVFSWTIVREYAPYRATAEIIKFHRLPMWTGRDVDAIERGAAELRARFGRKSEEDGQAGK